MKISNFAAYIAQLWRNKPDTSTPLSAERLRHIEDGIKGNSDAIEAIAAAVVNQIVNDPDKIASMAALYAVNQKVSALDGKVGDTAQLPDGATDVVTAITKQNSDLNGFHVYANISDLGLSNGVTVNDILPKMPEPSMGFFYVFDNNISKLPITTQANLIIFKSGSASDIVERSIWTGETYFGKYGGANKVESWVLIK